MSPDEHVSDSVNVCHGRLLLTLYYLLFTTYSLLLTPDEHVSDSVNVCHGRLRRNLLLLAWRV
jgi:hypothetical protein